MQPTCNVMNDFIPFSDWLVNYITENPGIKISFNQLKFEECNVEIVVELLHITGFKINRILGFDARDRVGKKRKFIEAIEEMTYQLKQEVNKWNCGVD